LACPAGLEPTTWFVVVANTVGEGYRRRILASFTYRSVGDGATSAALTVRPEFPRKSLSFKSFRAAAREYFELLWNLFASEQRIRPSDIPVPSGPARAAAPIGHPEAVAAVRKKALRRQCDRRRRTRRDRRFRGAHLTPAARGARTPYSGRNRSPSRVKDGYSFLLGGVGANAIVPSEDRNVPNDATKSFTPL